MLNSTEHEILIGMVKIKHFLLSKSQMLINVKMPTIVGISTFISRIIVMLIDLSMKKTRPGFTLSAIPCLFHYSSGN